MLITHTYNIFYLPCGDLCFERSASMTAGFYLGCFADAGGSGRVMEFAAASDDMDAEVRRNASTLQKHAPAVREPCLLLDNVV